MNDPILLRLGRVRAAIVDSTSYEMLWSSITDGLITPTPVTGDESVADNNATLDLDTHQSDTIPRIIFQTWKTRRDLPRNYAYWRATLLKQNPTFRYIFWDDYDNRHFIASKYPWFLDIYDRYPKEIFRSDAIRFFFLYSFGGFYADLDVECVRPLDDLLNDGDVLVGRMGKNPAFEHSIPNAVMASRPRQGFWLLAIAFMMERFTEAVRAGNLFDAQPERLTGPILLKDAVEYYISHPPNEIARRAALSLENFDRSEYHFGQLKVLPAQIWYPINWYNPAHQVFRRKMFRKRGVLSESSVRLRFGHSYMVHYWSHSW